jgi:hypothetical protein
VENPVPPLNFLSAKQSDKRIFDEGKSPWQGGFSAFATEL